MNKLFSLTLAAALAAVALQPDTALARERQSTITGANGKTATRHVVRAGGDVSSSTTLPGGKTSSRVVDRSASGTTATLTGPNGKTATRSVVRQP